MALVTVLSEEMILLLVQGLLLLLFCDWGFNVFDPCFEIQLCLDI